MVLCVIAVQVIGFFASSSSTGAVCAEWDDQLQGRHFLLHRNEYITVLYPYVCCVFLAKSLWKTIDTHKEYSMPPPPKNKQTNKQTSKERVEDRFLSPLAFSHRPSHSSFFLAQCLLESQIKKTTTSNINEKTKQNKSKGKNTKSKKWTTSKSFFILVVRNVW